MNERRALGFALSAVLLWSTVATAFKLTLAEFTPVQMLTVASIVSALALTLVCALQGKLPQVVPTFSANPLYFVLLGLINPLGYYLILFKAYDLLPASQAQAINYSWAITLTLMAAVFLGQKIRKQDWLACAFSYFGVVVIATQGDVLGMHFESPLGVGLALLSTLLWASYWILNTKKPRRSCHQRTARFSGRHSVCAGNQWLGRRRLVRHQCPGLAGGGLCRTV